MNLKEVAPIPFIPRVIQDQGSQKVARFLGDLQPLPSFVAASFCLDLLSWVLEDLEFRVSQGELEIAQLGLQYFQALGISVLFEHLPGINLILSRGIMEKTDQFQSEMKKFIGIASKMNRKALHDLFSKFLQNPQKIVEEVRRDLGKFSPPIFNSH